MAGRCTRSSSAGRSGSRRVLDQAEELLVGPLRVVDRDHQGLLAGDARQEPAPGGRTALEVVPARSRARAVPPAWQPSRPGALDQPPRGASRARRGSRPGRRRRRRRRPRAGSRRAPRTRSRRRRADCARPGPRVELVSSRTVASNSPASRVLPKPASPTIKATAGWRSRTARMYARRRARAPRRARGTASWASPVVGRTEVAGRATSGSANPLTQNSNGAPSSARRLPAAARAPTSTSPGSAVCCSRAAALMESPVTARSAPPDSTSTSPVSMPIRRRSGRRAWEAVHQ